VVRDADGRAWSTPLAMEDGGEIILVEGGGKKEKKAVFSSR
jgi:hypothetical protein